MFPETRHFSVGVVHLIGKNAIILPSARDEVSMLG
ncbi:Protein of unknown function [Lactobacillus helveticus CIRM-BIA 951]|uniref:Uncharacterized protein n=1 Tax=Lactobacillus helveticus CIRM-BIA 951 TaxID=1226334 RepID=U6F8N8_LACHE|nr:Protein of unknown function [Lactobacillus helveticus CIRM-BIA 951]